MHWTKHGLFLIIFNKNKPIIYQGNRLCGRLFTTSVQHMMSYRVNLGYSPYNFWDTWPILEIKFAANAITTSYLTYTRRPHLRTKFPIPILDTITPDIKLLRYRSPCAPTNQTDFFKSMRMLGIFARYFDFFQVMSQKEKCTGTSASPWGQGSHDYRLLGLAPVIKIISICQTNS
jgi:hypothetical protein